MQVELIEHYGTDLTPVNAARVSLGKESSWEDEHSKMRTGEDEHGTYLENTLREKDAKLIHYLAKHKHTSCFEHQGATLRLKVPIFIARQIQRHRTFSYNEISRRYVDNPPEFFWPEKWRAKADNVKQGSSMDKVVETMLRPVSDDHWPPQKVADEFIKYVNDLYSDMLDANIAPELARMILPQNMYTEFYMTGNLRSWAHFLQLRLDGHAQLEVQQVAQQVEALLRPLWPVSMEALMKESDETSSRKETR